MKGKLSGVALVILGVVVVLGAMTVSALNGVLVIDDFEHGLKKNWKHKDFKGKTDYTVISTGEGHVLKAESRDSATGLIYEIEFDPKEYPILSWRWKVENIYKKGDARTREGDDYPARVYVIFPHWFKPLTKSINYIWANRLHKGSYVPNTYYSKAIMIAVESGEENVGKWISEERNIYEDFKMVFGTEPPMVGGIALMTDSDNTGESSVAYYDDIRISTTVQ
jgi:hypothetical protein